MMKKFLTVIALLFIHVSFGQAVDIAPQTNTSDLYNTAGVDVKPEFPGGIEEFYKYIARNFYPPTAKQFKGGRIIATFIIEIDGSVTEIKVINDLGFGTKEETIRVLKECIKWTPAEQNGQKVRCSYALPITLQSN